MKSLLVYALAAMAIGTTPCAAQTVVGLQGASVEVLFNPGPADIGARLVSIIDSAKDRVWLAAYSFTHAGVAQALTRAKARGVDVRAVLDASQDKERYTGATYLRNAGVSVKINRAHAIFHHKVILVDSDVVGFGSANFTKAGMQSGRLAPTKAKANAENFNLFFRAAALSAVYAAEFERVAAEAE